MPIAFQVKTITYFDINRVYVFLILFDLLQFLMSILVGLGLASRSSRDAMLIWEGSAQFDSE